MITPAFRFFSSKSKADHYFLRKSREGFKVYGPYRSGDDWIVIVGSEGKR